MNNVNKFDGINEIDEINEMEKYIEITKSTDSRKLEEKKIDLVDQVNQNKKVDSFDELDFARSSKTLELVESMMVE